VDIKHAILSSLGTQNANHMPNRSDHSDKIAVQLTHRRLPPGSTNRMEVKVTAYLHVSNRYLGPRARPRHLFT
jgi:hypothetical protein